jgi:hypothetical protein
MDLVALTHSEQEGQESLSERHWYEKILKALNNDSTGAMWDMIITRVRHCKVWLRPELWNGPLFSLTWLVYRVAIHLWMKYLCRFPLILYRRKIKKNWGLHELINYLSNFPYGFFSNDRLDSLPCSNSELIKKFESYRQRDSLDGVTSP